MYERVQRYARAVLSQTTHSLARRRARYIAGLLAGNKHYYYYFSLSFILSAGNMRTIIREVVRNKISPTLFYDSRALSERAACFS
jgi:hypothetical protein